MEVKRGWRVASDKKTNNIYTHKVSGSYETVRVIPDCGHVYFINPDSTPRGRLCRDCERKIIAG